MHIRLICPAPPRSLYGNRITASRWVRMVRSLGHRASIADRYTGEPCDVLIALHAHRNAAAVFASREREPARPIVVALTGTDVYRDLPRSPDARQALELADRIIVLQPLALEEIDPRLRDKGRVIYQSAPKTRPPAERRADSFDVIVAGHLREVKDPFRTALAARGLPSSSRVRVLHLGAAMEPEMAEQASAEQKRNPRYRWLGPVSAGRTRRAIAASRLLVLSSRMEGGANVISEAAVDGVPVLASRIPGSVGLLGADYPGYFEVGNTAALTQLLDRAETDRSFYRELKTRCARLAPRFSPARERAAWKSLLGELRERASPRAVVCYGLP